MCERVASRDEQTGNAIRDLQRREMIDEHRRALAQRRHGVLLDLRVGRQHALGEAHDHGARHGEVLRSRRVSGAVIVDRRAAVLPGGEGRCRGLPGGEGRFGGGLKDRRDSVLVGIHGGVPETARR